MPTSKEREYYRLGFFDGIKASKEGYGPLEAKEYSATKTYPRKRVRNLSAWNKFVKANSKTPRFRMRSGKLNLKKMAVAFRKTPAGKKKRR